MFCNFRFLVQATAVFAAAMCLTGCGRSENQPPILSVTPTAAAGDSEAPAGKPAVEPEEAHAHKAGARGGIIVSLGRDSYHAEAVFEKGGILRLYTLGKDEAMVHEVDSQTLRAFAKRVGSD